MASNPVANRVRSDSAFDDVESISKTFVTAQSFCTAVSLFASENGIQDLTKLLEVLPRRDNDIKSRDAAILDLQARLDAQEESHKTDTQKQMSNFENRYAVWSKANTILQNEISELRKASQERETELMQLRQELEVGKRRIEDVETRLRERIETSKAKDQQIVELKSRLQSALLDADSRREELKLSHGQIAVLESTLEQKEEKYKTVHDTARKRRETIQKFEGFSVTMTELDIPVIAKRVEGLWTAAISLVGNYIGGNLPEHILQCGWAKLHDNDIFKPRIAIPQSNSDIAKEMRVGVVLGALARLIDNFVFQPTYLLNEKSELREYLCHQATIDPHKERYTRGILLSMFHEDQESNSKDAITSVVQDLLTTVGVDVLLNADNTIAFKESLEQLVAKFRDEWSAIQRGKQKLEPNFTHSVTSGHPWHLLDIQGIDIKKSRRNKADLSTSNIDDNTVVVPRLYLMTSEDEPSPITSGYVLRKDSQIAAENEVRSCFPSTPFAGTTSRGQRNRRVRPVSMASDTAPADSTGSRFLSQGRGVPDS